MHAGLYGRRQWFCPAGTHAMLSSWRMHLGRHLYHLHATSNASRCLSCWRMVAVGLACSATAAMHPASRPGAAVQAPCRMRLPCCSYGLAQQGPACLSFFFVLHNPPARTVCTQGRQGLHTALFVLFCCCFRGWRCGPLAAACPGPLACYTHSQPASKTSPPTEIPPCFLLPCLLEACRRRRKVRPASAGSDNGSQVQLSEPAEPRQGGSDGRPQRQGEGAAGGGRLPVGHPGHAGHPRVALKVAGHCGDLLHLPGRRR